MFASPHSLSLLATATALALGLGACHKTPPPAAGGDAGTAQSASGGLPLPSGFEGEIDVAATGESIGDKPTLVSLFVKDGKVRLDVPEALAKSSANPFGTSVYVILDSAAKQIDAVFDSRRQVIRIDLNKAGEALKGFGGPRRERNGPAGTPSPQSPPTKLTKTGKVETVAGYKCEDWDIASDHREGTVCVAQDGFSWFSLPATGIPTERLWMAELVDGKHFPLRFVGYGKDGVKEVSRIEVTKLDKKSLPASEFQVPPSYVVLDLATMFRGFGAMPGGFPMPGPRPAPGPAPGPRGH